MTTLLTPDDIRGLYPETSLSDESIQLLLDAAEAEMDRFAGGSGEVVEWHGGGGQHIALARPVGAIASVVEHNWHETDQVTLQTDDYEVDPSGYLLYRRHGGTNSRWRWWGRVVVTYTPADDEAIRKGVEADLVGLMINYQPGANAETVGSWTTQLSSNATWNNDEERQMILSRLVVHGRMAVV